MRFKDWLLAEEAKNNAIIMFHGTSMAFWDNIKQNGLEPFPAQRSWDVDPEASFHRASRASYGGIYLTGNVLTATASAFRTAQKTKTNQLLIVVEVDRRVLVADEDTVDGIVNRVHYPGLAFNDYTISLLYMSRLNDDEVYAQAKKEYVDKVSSRLLSSMSSSNEALKKHVSKLLNEVGFDAVLNRMVAHASKYSRDGAANQYGKEDVTFPVVQDAEAKYKAFVDRLTHLVRILSDPDADFYNHTARIMKKIGYSGPNRIVYAAELVESPTKKYRTAAKTLYGKAPPELLTDWQKKEGEWEEIQSPG